MPPGGRPGGPMGRFMTEEEKASQPKITGALLKRVFSYLKPYWKQFVLVLLCIGLSSALDSISESKIQEAIDPIIAERTSILIAHRLSTILAADEILVVKDGEIVERGHHKELVNRGGVYTELYRTQFRSDDGQDTAETVVQREGYSEGE